MIYLITGASGFIGFHLAKKLSSSPQNKLILVDNFQRGKNDNEFSSLIKKRNVSFLNIDLTKKESFKKFPNKIDIIYHLAAINGTKHFYDIPDRVLFVNTMININMLEYLKNNSKIKCIFASSSETYASTTEILKNRIPSRESIELSIGDISNVRFSYAVSKIFGEMGFFAYAKSFNIDFHIVRFHNIYGPRMGYDHVVPELYKKIKSNDKAIELHGWTNTRSFCYIDDAVDALLLLRKNIKTKIIHIGNDMEEIKIYDLCKELIMTTKKNLKIIKKKAPPGSVKRRKPDIKLLRSMGFTPKINLKQGLKKTINWYSKDFL